MLINDALRALTAFASRGRGIQQELAEVEASVWLADAGRAAVVWRLQPFSESERAIKVMMKIPDPEAGDH